jgi:hypothetical protein
MNILKSAASALGLTAVALAAVRRSRKSNTKTATIAWNVRVPSSTPTDAPVYLAGNLPELGPWKPDGLQLRRTSTDQYSAKLQVPPGETFEYKFTRGDWETVETGKEGTQISNRVLTIERSERVIVEVEAWGDQN